VSLYTFELNGRVVRVWAVTLSEAYQYVVYLLCEVANRVH